MNIPSSATLKKKLTDIKNKQKTYMTQETVPRKAAVPYIELSKSTGEGRNIFKCHINKGLQNPFC